MPSKPNPDRFLSFAEVAEMLGLKVKTIRNGKCGTHTLPRIRLGGRVLFSFNAVQAWMAHKAREAERARLQSEMAINSLMASKSERRLAVQKTLLTIINGGKYR